MESAALAGLDCALEIVTGIEFDAIPAEFRTSTCATDGCARALLPTCAASVFEFTTVVGTEAPLKTTADLESKLLPVTVTVALGVPTWMTCGET